MHVMITGAAGFIGSTLSLRLLERGDTVTGIDNLNDYYDVSLKEARLARLMPSGAVQISSKRISQTSARCRIRFSPADAFDAVVNLAAQAGVRYSIENPAAYINANLVGFGTYSGGLPAQRRWPSCLCLVKFSLRFQHQVAVFRKRQRRPPDFSLCGEQESQ